jgi:hypothetical protein
MGFFKRHKVWSVLLGIIVVVVVGFSLFWLVKSIVVSNSDCPTERHYVTFMTGVVEPAWPVFLDKGDLAQMKEDNMNTLQIYFPTSPDPLQKPFILGVIKEAKKQGLAVHVGGNPGPAASEEAITEKKIERYTKVALEWAELCEGCGVEYFSPLAEADHVMGRDRAVAWHAEILPEIRKVFSGKVLAHWANYGNDDVAMGPEWEETEAYCYRVEASGDFDGVMLDFQSPTPLMIKYWFDPSKPKEEADPYRPNSLETIAITTSEAAAELGIPIYVGEFYVETGEAPAGLNADRAIFSEEEQAEFVGKFIDTFAPHYDGIIHCSWFSFMNGIEDTPAEQVIREKFGALQ